MSDTDTDDQLPDATFDDVPLDSEGVENATADSPDESEIRTPKKGGAWASIAWLSLFLSCIAVAGIGYMLLEKMRSESSADERDKALAAVQHDVDASAQFIEALKSDVDGLSSDDARVSSAVNSLRQDIDQRAELFNSLPPRLSNLERSVAALQGVSIEARNTYLIAEAEHYMQIANAQLQLAGNPYLASLALGQADDRLLQLADPALTDVRRAIANELAALEVMEKPDIAGVTLVLASLAHVVESLPMRGATGATSAEADAAVSDPGAVARAWAAVKDAASGLVKVTPPDGDKAALITPDVADLARTNLSLQLQAARLALLRSEQEIFEQSLDDADTWLELYFDTASEQVRSTRQTITEIRTEYTTVAPPDISQSLRLLRQFKLLAESAQ